MGSVYGENCDISRVEPAENKWNIGDSKSITGVMYYAVDPEGADRLWKLSEQLTGATI